MKRSMGRIMDKRKFRGLCAEKRVRTQFMFADFDTMTDTQAMELMLSYVLPYENCVIVARKLVDKFGSLAKTLVADKEELKVAGETDNYTAEFIKFCSTLPRLYAECESRRRIFLGGIKDTISFATDNLDFEEENYYYICLNAKNEVLYYNTMGDFPIGKMFTTNREMFKQILKFPTKTVIICHINPSGNAKPTLWEIRFTRELRDLLNTLSIGLTDHIILGNEDSYFSFYQIGLLNPDCPKFIDDMFADYKMEIYADDLRCQGYRERKNKKRKFLP